MITHNKSVKIPKIIMQTWKTSTHPPQWQRSRDAINTYMSSWKYVLMTDDDNLAFVKQYFPDFLETFVNFPYPIQRADAIRYMWFYVHGGIYLDLDLEIIKALDELFYEYADMYVVKSIFMQSVYTNAFMASQARNPIMIECLRLMKMPLSISTINTQHFIVINSTGPNMYTKAIENTKLLNSHLIIKELPQRKIINCDVCGVHNPYSRAKAMKGAYIHNLGGSSWAGNDSSILSLAYCKKETVLVFFIIIVFIIIVKSIKRRPRYKRK